MIKLHYWPGLPGRGEFIRLVLEARAIPYVDLAREPDGAGSASVLAARAGELGGLRPFAPPIVEIDGEVLSQTGAICDLLASRYELAPTEPVRRAQALQLFLTAMDVAVEAHDTHHPIAKSLYYDDQREAAAEAARLFRTGRMIAWLAYWSDVLSWQPGPWIFGEMVSYADLALAHVIDGLAHAFPRALARAIAEHPELNALRDRAWALPKLSAYRASDRWQPFNEHGLFRYYPELDG